MFHHVAVFRWVEGTLPDAVEALASALAGLPGLIPDIRAYRFGADAGLGLSANADFAVVADFDDTDGYAAYAGHPAHQDVIERLLKPLVAERLSVQFVFSLTDERPPDGG